MRIAEHAAWKRPSRDSSLWLRMRSHLLHDMAAALTRSVALLARAGGCARSHVYRRHALDDFADRCSTDGERRQRNRDYWEKPDDDGLSGSRIFNSLRRLQRHAGAELGWTGPTRIWSSARNRTWGGQPSALPCYIAERRQKLPDATGTEAGILSTSVNWVEFITAFRTLQAPVPRAVGDVGGISATKYAPTMYSNLTATFTINGQTGFCSDCDPPSNPPKACTSAGRKTGAYVHRLNGTNYCTY